MSDNNFQKPKERRWSFDLPMSGVMRSHNFWTEEELKQNYAKVVIRELDPDLERDACKEMVAGSVVHTYSMFAKWAIVSINGRNVSLLRDAVWSAIGENGRATVILMRNKATTPTTEHEIELAKEENAHTMASFCTVVY